MDMYWKREAFFFFFVFLFFGYVCESVWGWVLYVIFIWNEVKV